MQSNSASFYPCHPCNPWFTYQRCSRLIHVCLLSIGYLASAGCRGPMLNECGCGLGSGVLRARLAPPIDEGPQLIQPPHSRFHPVPTHPVFATHSQHLEELPRAGNGVKIPLGSGSGRAPKGKAMQPLKTPENRPLEKTPVEDSRPDVETPRGPPASSSSGVTLTEPRSLDLPERQFNVSPHGGWRGRMIVR